MKGIKKKQEPIYPGSDCEAVCSCSLNYLEAGEGADTREFQFSREQQEAEHCANIYKLSDQS